MSQQTQVPKKPAPASGRAGDAKRAFRVDHLHLDKEVGVEETTDFWVIRDSVLTQPGVYNRSLRLKEDLARTWIFANGVPIVHEHPDVWGDENGVVIDMRRVAGWVDNVRYDDATGRWIGDYYLLKHPIEGCDVTPENVKRNEGFVASVRAGVAPDNSLGYHCRIEYAHGILDEREYDEIRRELMADHLAIVPVGACNTKDGCGFGQAQPNQDSRGGPREHAPPAHKGDKKQMEPKQDCQDMQELQRRLKEAESRADAAQKVAKEALDSRAALDEKLNVLRADIDAERKARQDAEKTRLDGKRDALATLTGRKADAYQGVPEPALDAMLEDARRFHATGRQDGTMLLGAGAAPPKVGQDGILESEEAFTVGDWEKVAPNAQGKGTTVVLGRN